MYMQYVSRLILFLWFVCQILLLYLVVLVQGIHLYVNKISAISVDPAKMVYLATSADFCQNWLFSLIDNNSGLNCSLSLICVPLCLSCCKLHVSTCTIYMYQIHSLPKWPSLTINKFYSQTINI